METRPMRIRLDIYLCPGYKLDFKPGWNLTPWSLSIFHFLSQPEHFTLVERYPWNNLKWRKLSAQFPMAGIITNVLQAIQLIETARDHVRGRSQTTKKVATQLDSIYRSLSLVRDERDLQTASVEQHCVVIIGIADELRTYFDRIWAQQKHGTVRQFFSALKNGDKNDAELSEILARLDRAPNELVLRISVAQVGLMGDMNQGFKVAYDLLMNTNRKCKKILGTDLQLASQLKGRQPERNGQVPLEHNELQELGLVRPQKQTDNLDITFSDNVTLDQARMIMGNVGVQNWEHTARMKVTMSGNKFGNNLSLVVGNVDALPIERVFG